MVGDGLDHGRRELLGGQAVAAADDLDRPAGEGQGDVEIERLADRAGLLGPVEDGDLPGRGRDGRVEGGGVEGPVEADLDETELGARGR
jgi:hypothetical protein